MQVIRAASAGMCFGVRDALAVAAAIRDPGSVTIQGEMVHNPEVARQLDERGFHQVEESERDRPASTPVVMITAHGISERRRAALVQAGKALIDTTCPLVRHVHDAAQRFRSEGRFVVVIGRPGHVEVQGIVEDLEESAVVADPSAVIRWNEPRIGVVCQSTTPPHLADEVLAAITRLNAGSDVQFVNTICRPTRERQEAVHALLDQVDLLVVVGGRHSNNTLQLVALAESLGIRAIHLETAAEVDPAAFGGCRVVGLTAGTSTLDRTVDEVEAALAALPAAQLVAR